MILINPPPNNSKCYQCNKIRKLTKTFRATMKGTEYEQVGASWECSKCINYEVKK